MELLNYARPFGYSPYNNYAPRPEGMATLAKIAVQLLSAMAELNELGFVYCDLKPENIMYAEDDHFKLKIVDLGSTTPFGSLSNYYSDFEVQSIAYRAPEVFLGDPTFNHKIDIWSLGVILLEFYINNYIKSTKKLDYWRLISVRNKDTIVEGMIEKFGSAVPYKNRAKFWMPKYEILSNNRQSALLLDSLRGPGHNPEIALFLNFLASLLAIDHNARPSAALALTHPFLTKTLLGHWVRYLTNPSY
ncbi:hypothetical protein TRVA0_002S00694 [Trichomonascus vanleenenianus]|uniref:uncharacterized protein n=1 Tax=Trichomonascus vanleenenianus TaxID=2268995 RepID=UPI003ECB7C61